MSNWTALALTIIASSSVASCKTFPSGDMSPAVLNVADASSKTALETAAAKVLNRKSVKLGGMDLANSPAVSVLPERSVSPSGAPFNQQDFAIPTMLIMMTDGSNCFLVKEDTRDWAHVPGLDCRSIGPVSTK